MLDASVMPRLRCNHNGMWDQTLADPQPSGSHPAWCVVATYANAEFRADLNLRRQGHDTFLPLVTRRKRHRFLSGRTSLVPAPLWSGYLFVALDLNRPWRHVQNTLGVYSLITNAAGIPQPCRPGVLEAVQAAVAQAATKPPETPRSAPGDAVSLRKGHVLAGHPAVVLSVGLQQAIVAVMLFGHLRELSVSLDAIQPRTD